MTRALLFVALACIMAQGVSAQDLGRLFFTPEQRAALDARRKAKVPEKPAAAVEAAPVTRIDGYVQRSAGPATVWVNGESVPAQAPEAPRIDPRAGEPGVSINVGEGGNRVRLKPGQTLDRASGEVKDVLGGGEVRVRKKP